MAYQPKSYRKFVATAATATLVASAIAPVAGAASNFTDVAPKYQDAVDYLVANNITKGATATTFGTHDDIKRGDLAIWLAAALKLDTTGAAASGFEDTKGTRYDAAVSVLKAKGYINGKTATEFAPSASVTRGEMAIMLSNAYDLKSDTATKFTDAVGNYKTAIQGLYAFGVTTGKSETMFGTSMNITRGDLAIFLKRAAEVVKTPAVTGVNAINATQVEVNFNTPVSKASLFENGKSGAFKSTATVTLTTLTADNVPSGALTGTLSADGKTLTITSQYPLSKRYDVVIDGLKTTSNSDVTKYNQVVNFAADTTAPTILSTTKNSAGSFTVKFSEPIKSLGSVSFKYANGTTIAAGTTTVSDDFAPGAQEVTFTLGTGIDAGKEVVATFIGAQDQASNLLTPNPASVSFVKGAKDGVAPTVTSVTQTAATTFAVKFSEALLSDPTVTVAGTTVTNVDQDSTDPTVYNVTTTGVLDGLTNVTVSSFYDLSGEQGTDVTKVASFTKDTVAPKVVSSNVVADSTNNKQYLELTFDKDVVLTSANVDATGSFVKDYVTTSISASALSPTALTYKDSNNKKVVRVELDALLGGATTDVEGAAYNLDLTFTGVTSPAAVAVETAKATFTRGKDGVAANTDVVAVTNVAQGSNNSKVEVTFNKAVDGASATNVSNYRIDGAVIESVTLKPAVTDGSGNTSQVAVLNLKSGSNGFTGTRNIYVSGVKALGSSKVMNAYHTNAVILKENIAPVVTSAKLTATNKITLTFSEAVTDATAFDFEVLIGGKSQGTVEEVNAGVGSTAANTVEITIDNIDSTELSKGISLKALDTLDIEDAANNKLSVPTNISVAL